MKINKVKDKEKGLYPSHDLGSGIFPCTDEGNTK